MLLPLRSNAIVEPRMAGKKSIIRLRCAVNRTSAPLIRKAANTSTGKVSKFTHSVEIFASASKTCVFSACDRSSRLTCFADVSDRFSPSNAFQRSSGVDGGTTSPTVRHSVQAWAARLSFCSTH